MLEAGLSKRQRRRAKHRGRRPRRAPLGELEQWDSSVHAWLEDRVAGDQVLISIHDDATSRLIWPGSSSATTVRRTAGRSSDTYSATVVHWLSTRTTPDTLGSG